MNQVAVRPDAGASWFKVDWMNVPRDGELVNGDGVLVRQDGDRLLVAVIDSLGHGPKANEVTVKALEHLETARLDGGVQRLMESLHAHLRGSRGAAALLLLATRDTIEASGVGNVEMRAQRTSIPLVLSAGVLGHRLRLTRVASAKLSHPDRIVVFTDGISRRFDFNDIATLPPKEASSRIFANCRRAHDDATILVLDFP